MTQPASGHRGGGSGNLSHVGERGYAWSGSPHSVTTMYGSSLLFGSSTVDPESNDYRAVGFPVRCVQE